VTSNGHRVHFASMPPTALMTGNTIQAVLDAIDVNGGSKDGDAATVRARLGSALRGIIWFAGGCAAAALLYYWFGFGVSRCRSQLAWRPSFCDRTERVCTLPRGFPMSGIDD
jgi:hypothetical protein